MNGRYVLKSSLICPVLILAPLAWAISIQLGQILPYVDCTNPGNTTAIVAGFATAIAFLAAGLSWKARSRLVHSDATRTRRFVGSTAGLMSLVFGFALFLQFLASLMLNACER